LTQSKQLILMYKQRPHMFD